MSVPRHPYVLFYKLLQDKDEVRICACDIPRDGRSKDIAEGRPGRALALA